MRPKLEMEADMARGAVRGALEDMKELDQRWAASKRGSNAQRVFDRLKGRLECALECLNDGLANEQKDGAS
jgi:hypothetical protein